MFDFLTSESAILCEITHSYIAVCVIYRTNAIFKFTAEIKSKTVFARHDRDLGHLFNIGCAV